MQDVGDIGKLYVDDSGYNAWADTNRIIVLYPQTVERPFLGLPPQNPQACWDWWSYVTHDDSYVTKSGGQIKAIKAMLDALVAGEKPGSQADRTGRRAWKASRYRYFGYGRRLGLDPGRGRWLFGLAGGGWRRFCAYREDFGPELRGQRLETFDLLSLAGGGHAAGGGGGLMEAAAVEAVPCEIPAVARSPGRITDAIVRVSGQLRASRELRENYWVRLAPPKTAVGKRHHDLRRFV